MKTQASHRLARRSLLSLALFATVSAGFAGPGDGEYLGTVRLVDHGSDAERFDVVLISEGYRASEMDRFAEDAAAFAAELFATAPFDRLAPAINVWRIDVASLQSGADDPAGCLGGTGRRATTWFDSSYCVGGTHRSLLSVAHAPLLDLLAIQVPAWDQAIVLVNSSIPGGLAGSVTITSRAEGWERRVLHQIGHAAFGLADEYAHWDSCDPGAGTPHHPAVEPVAPNVSAAALPSALPWADLLHVDLDTPGTRNDDCGRCDPQADPYGGATVVGRFEGAHHAHCDAWRPAFSCMMRDLGPFCPVCSRQIERRLAAYLPESQNSPPQCEAGGPYVAECSGQATTVLLDGSGSSDADGDGLLFTWSGPFDGGAAEGDPAEVTFPAAGVYEVELTVSDGQAASTCVAQVEIHDTIAPVISVALTPAELWPPNHRMRDVEAGIVLADACDPAPSVTLVEITSNEPENGTGDGDTAPDIADALPGSDDRAFRLRAERSGDGDGRVYTVIYESSDAAGNRAVISGTVVVPKSRGH